MEMEESSVKSRTVCRAVTGRPSGAIRACLHTKSSALSQTLAKFTQPEREFTLSCKANGPCYRLCSQLFTFCECCLWYPGA